MVKSDGLPASDLPKPKVGGLDASEAAKLGWSAAVVVPKLKPGWLGGCHLPTDGGERVPASGPAPRVEVLKGTVDVTAVVAPKGIAAPKVEVLKGAVDVAAAVAPKGNAAPKVEVLKGTLEVAAAVASKAEVAFKGVSELTACEFPNPEPANTGAGN